MNRADQARELFLSGYNCAQSVLISFADELKFSRELAQKMAAGFGGGMGKQQETCGAVTGAVMVLGLLSGERASNNDELKSAAYANVKEFFRKFEQEFGFTGCRELTGCDLNTGEGSARFSEEGIMENVCAGCVARAVELVESIGAG
jgi:C_GCAxxG_C_C family probable redox protein